MQEFVFFIEGEVGHPLTIDPTVWIFDERKVDLDTYFEEIKTKEDEETAYKKAISAQWDKEITEGSAPPRPNSNGNEIRYEKQKLINGSFGMPLKPFLINAEPLKGVANVEITEENGTQHVVTLADALAGIVGFSHKGQPLREDGPIHFYFGDGSNQTSPIKNVCKFTLQKG
ncbi:peptidyl-prolyl cis-trans isomerase [Halalkalibacter alkaliphilus]|uniref:Peptidyl-prolyl cis-trans isomerase n=1 Tax=Halalkalibacter alkaliphilus TaxID=2917993 RepID=A0A9X2CRK1_9BACI|nr:peptidyl-prolyl cis-trans isomerase [Halalkalibacter alkaliphilus]MCL7746324.1 peptidyl-prolyl cis-trans isomerase [Halalkalibacter alkaliphilus]